MNSPELYLAALFNLCFPTLNWQGRFPFHLVYQTLGTLELTEWVNEWMSDQGKDQDSSKIRTCKFSKSSANQEALIVRLRIFGLIPVVFRVRWLGLFYLLLFVVTISLSLTVMILPSEELCHPGYPGSPPSLPRSDLNEEDSRQQQALTESSQWEGTASDVLGSGTVKHSSSEIDIKTKW